LTYLTLINIEFMFLIL